MSAYHPRDHVLPGKGWEVFKNARLNTLEEQVASANQSIALAEAQYRQAQHTLQSARSAYFPNANTHTATANRFRAASGQNVVGRGLETCSGSRGK